ncbi:substrate-binding domain-containing protein [Vibrio hippocampi]|uniref:Autoinducer 2-binding periplasmic protein LuxP n=1 Tax=Vibrio hippocampi TaxID=654686 RepID=A0ABM8ZN66_9VIBR|nr:substrate-binding domain-containing protein [Vibrio hippocampi]CAH0529670.1 Ribose import binding protein RbsB [Vibrio hippocampi]
MKTKIMPSIIALILWCIPALSAAAQETIGVVLSNLSNPYFIAVQNAIDAHSKRLGYETLVYDSNNELDSELASIRALVEKKVTAIIYNPTDLTGSTGSYQAIKIANQANIPIVVLDRRVERGSVLSRVISDNVEGGEMAGSFIIAKLGDRANVVQLLGYRNLSTTRERNQGFMNVVNNSSLNLMTSIEADYSRSKAKKVMLELLKANPSIHAVFAHNDQMAMGAVEAIEALHADVLVVGYDGTDVAKQAIKQGRLAATIDQQAGLVGQRSVKVIDTWLSGGQVKTYIAVSTKIIGQ